MTDERQDVLVEDAEQLAEVPRAARRVCGQAFAHRFERVRLEDRSVSQPFDPGDEHLDDRETHLAHLVGRQRKWIRTHLPLECTNDDRPGRDSPEPECSRARGGFRQGAT